MKTKKLLVMDNMKDIAIEEHAYFGYHFEKEEQHLFSTTLYFSKKDDNASLEAIEKVCTFTKVTSLVPSIIFLSLSILTITVMFILFFLDAINFNASNFLLLFILPLLVFMSVGSLFAIKRTIEVSRFVTSPRKNLEKIKQKLNIQ